MSDVPVVRAADSERDQRRAAAALRGAGLSAGDRVLLSAPASPALLAVVLGALRTGVVPVVLDPTLPDAERAALAGDADAALDAGAQPERLLSGDELADLADVPLARPMHYTSGTTGRRKGVWSGVLPDDDAGALAAEETDLWGFTADDRHLVLSPLHHSAPLRFAIHTLLAGGSVLLPGPFEAQRAAEAIAACRPTTVFGVPTHLRRLLAHGVDWASFRLIAHAGAPCPEPVKRAMLDAAPRGSVWEFYGSTEAQFTVCSPDDWLAHPGSVGRARPGRTMTTDGRGQLWCTVPRCARFEYWRAPEKTAAAWRGDRVTVGDLGRVDDDGVVWLDGRREDLVISGGVNVYPAEVEAVLDEHPDVVESAVFGVPDDDWGQRVVAGYVGTADPAALAEWARERLGPAKRPKSLHRLAELPRTSTGKLRRLDLPAVLGLPDRGDGR